MISVKFGSEEYKLKSTWAASMEFSDLIGDPLEIAVKFDSGEQVLTALDVVKTLWIALKHSGYEMTLNDVGEMCHKYGTLNYYIIAKSFVYSLVINESEAYSEDDTEGKS